MKTKLMVLYLFTILMYSGCGPTLDDSKVQYVKSVTAAKSTLDVLNTLIDANQLSSEDVAKIKPIVANFEINRKKVRDAIDANVPAPALALTNLDELLDALILIEIEKEGVK